MLINRFVSKTVVWNLFIVVFGVLQTHPAYAQSTSASVECELDQANSIAVIRVYKEGKLSAFGDNHLISTSYLEGKLLLDPATPTNSMFNLSIPTQSLVVNDPALRAAAEDGFNSKVSALNRRITRKSMLGKKVLYAKRYPAISIRSSALPPDLTGDSSMAITLRDTTRNEKVALISSFEGDRLSIKGRFNLQQSDYGIEPFSIMFGGIRVKDTLRLDFELLSRCPIS